MNKRKANLSQPPPLHQKQLIQSILQFVPLEDAMLSANVCKSWHNATKNGIKFHPERFKLVQMYNDEWCISSDSTEYFRLDDIPQPKRSYILEIVDSMHFIGSRWPEAIANLELAPPNLKRLTFDEVAPTQHEFVELVAKIDITNVEEVRFDDFWHSSTPVEHILNGLQSLKQVEFFGVYDIIDMVDFKKVKPIETMVFCVMDDMPNLEGKVKVLRLWDHFATRMVGFNLALFQGVEKIILEIELVHLLISEEELELRCEEICFTLASAKETSLKTFVIKTLVPSLLQRIYEEPRYHDVDGWSCSLSNDEMVFKRIEK